MGSQSSKGSIYDFTVKDAQGNDVDLSTYRGKVLLIVNVASQCGLTNSNYTELSRVYEKYKNQGLEILAFPCNQFGVQEPGSNEEILQFACARFMAEFPIFDKVDVNGENAAPLSKFLQSSEEGGHSATLTEELENYGGPKKFSSEELVTATGSFADDRILGRGGSGIVYKGHIGDAHTPVAVKKITSGSRQGIEEYKAEVKSLSQLNHGNLVRLMGYCHEANEFVLVYEFIGGGSLEDHLFKGRILLTWERRYNIALDLCSALHYLQKQCRRCVIHRDIKSSNIMLDEKFTAILADFGLAKLVDHTRWPHTTQVKGTPGYMAPEYYRTGKASKESDIYSLGVVLLEIVCGRSACDPDLVEQGPGLVRWVWKINGRRSRSGRWFRKVHLPVDERLGKDFDKKQAEALMMAGLWCAHPIAESRPSIEEAMAVLKLKAKPPKLPFKMPVSDI